jgi:hypothetical protein
VDVCVRSVGVCILGLEPKAVAIHVPRLVVANSFVLSWRSLGICQR